MYPHMQLKNNLNRSIIAKKQLLEDTENLEIFNQAAQLIKNKYKSGGRLYIAGNGGSAADAQHLAAEFVSKLSFDRAPMPAEALTVDSSIITAIGNDYGYEFIFARQLAAKATEKDAFLGITTSGQSPNILRAIEQCRILGIPSIVFTGRNGGAAKELCDYCIIAPGQETSTIQETHIILAHTLCEYVEWALFSDNNTID